MTDKKMAMKLISQEYDRATAKFGKFNSTHEGYAVLKEEVDELWDDIKNNRKCGDEAIQVGAMAVRILVDCCPQRIWENRKL